MNKRLRPLARLLHPRTRGQALVEFALIVPVLMLLLVAAVDFGRLFFTYVEVNNAAREGAAYGAGSPTDSTGIQDHAVQETNAQSQRGESPLTVTESCADPSGNSLACSNAAGGGGSGNTITVSVSERFTFLTPLINNLVGNNFQLSSSATAAVLELAAGGGGTPGNCTTQPTASFTVSVSGLSVSVDASASTPTTGQCAISGYNWDMGDGADPFPPVIGLRPPSYTYAAAGTYTITLNVTNPANPDPGVSTSQTITVGTGKSSPKLATTPSPGGPLTTVLTDTATLVGATNPTGSITFQLYGPGDATCQTAIRSVTVPLTGASATSAPGYTATQPGTYQWVASYAGDANNNAASSPCGSEPVVITNATPPPPTCPVQPTFTYTFTGNGNGAKAHEMTFYGAYSGQPVPTSWVFAFGDGNSSSGKEAGNSTQANDYSKSGTYTVTLTVTNGSCQATSTAQQVTVP